MATKRKRRSGDNGKPEWQGFINHSLGTTDKENIKGMVASGQADLLVVQELTEAGYSFKIQHDAYSGCVSVIMFGGADSGENAGWAMSCRHTDLNVAMAGILYQHFDLSGDNDVWPKPTDITSEHDW